ncbi:MAG: PQQ-binding-like beta-propeller repeat protein [Sphingomonas sp.]
MALSDRHRAGTAQRLRGRNAALLLVLASLVAGCGARGPAADAQARLTDGGDGRDWAAFGATYGEQHFSPLAEITRDNVAQLGLAWSMDLPVENANTGPLAVDGVLYFATGHSHVQAVDAASGKLLWEYDAKAREASGDRLRQGWGSRGIAWWAGKIYTGTQDGRLIAIDARTGKQVWSVMTLQKGDYRFISGPPRAFDGKIIVGHGGADADAMRGYVTAYDAETGKAGMALLGSARKPRRRLRERGDGQGRQDLVGRVVEARRRRRGVERDHLRRRDRHRLHRHRQRRAVEPPHPQRGQGRQSLSLLDRRARRQDRRL